MIKEKKRNKFPIYIYIDRCSFIRIPLVCHGTVRIYFRSHSSNPVLHVEETGTVPVVRNREGFLPGTIKKRGARPRREEAPRTPGTGPPSPPPPPYSSLFLSRPLNDVLACNRFTSQGISTKLNVRDKNIAWLRLFRL